MAAACNLITFFREAYQAIPNWILVIIALERMIGVLFPHRIHQWATKAKFCIYLSVVMAVTIIPFFVFVYFVEYELGLERYCEVKANRFLDRVRVIWSTLMISVGPSFFIVVFNATIIGRLFYSSRMQRRMVASSVDRHMMQITISLIAVSVAFVLLTMPQYINKLNPHVYITSHEEFVESYLKRLIIHMLTMINNGINFWLYCMTMKDFTRRLIRRCCKICGMCKR